MRIENLSQASHAVSSAHKSYLDYLDKEKNLSASWNGNVRDRCYKMLATLYGAALSLVDDRALLSQLCVQENVQVPDKKENPFSPTVRLLCRTKDKNENIKPAKPSTWIYSKYFRAAQHLGWTADNFAKKVAAFEFEHDGKKSKWLSGLAKLHDKEFGSTDDDWTKRVEEAARMWVFRKNPSQGVVQGLTGFPEPKNGQMASLVVEFNGSDWVVRGIHQTDSDKAFALISKQVVEEFNAWREKKSLEAAEAELTGYEFTTEQELLAAVAEQNRVQGEANEAAYAAANDQDAAE